MTKQKTYQCDNGCHRAGSEGAMPATPLAWANRDTHFGSRLVLRSFSEGGLRDSKSVGQFAGDGAASGEALYKYTREADNATDAARLQRYAQHCGQAKSPVLFERNACRCLLISMVTWLTVTLSANAQGPAWWFTRGAVDANLQANDFAPITQGQLKWMATNACAEIDAYFGAGTGVTAVVAAFSNTNNYDLANLGQVKYVAQPFYDRLYELDLTNTLPAGMPGYYPWGNSSETNDYALANIGQVKYVFSFDSAVDSDSDGMPDWWEVAHNLNPYANDASSDPDNDGLTNLQEYQNGTDPQDSDTDDDGMPDGWEVEHGLNPLVNDASLDPDGDGLTNLQEYQYETDAQDADTDDDGLSDGYEVEHGLEPLDPDTDGDGLSDGWEVTHGYDPLDDGDANEVIVREAARQKIVRHWMLFYGTVPVFTNTPGSEADLIDMRDKLNELSGKFYKQD